MERVNMTKQLFIAALNQLEECESILLTSTLGVVSINLN